MLPMIFYTLILELEPISNLLYIDQQIIQISNYEFQP